MQETRFDIRSLGGSNPGWPESLIAPLPLSQSSVPLATISIHYILGLQSKNIGFLTIGVVISWPPLFYDQQNGSMLDFTQCRSIRLGSMENADLAVSTKTADLGVFLRGLTRGCFKPVRSTTPKKIVQPNWAMSSSWGLARGHAGYKRALGGFLHLFSPLTILYSIKIKESYRISHFMETSCLLLEGSNRTTSSVCLSSPRPTYLKTILILR
jgi:hypothetical protein